MTDPDYYNLDNDTIGDRLSALSSTVSAICLAEELIVGPLVDLMGRKWPIVFAFASVVAGCVIMPLFKSLWGGFFVAKLLIMIGYTLIMDMPLIPDLVQEKDLGRALGI